jgi:hypothetical protein
LLIESNKVQAPSILLEDFVYFSNKSIGQYFNKRYNLYDVSQQLSDDLRVLKSTAILTPTLNSDLASSNLLKSTYEVFLPDDYVHMLGCVVEFTTIKKKSCLDAGDLIQYNARRLTADMFPAIINNYYMRPSYKNPYFYINNISTDSIYPINEIQESVTNGSITLGSTVIQFGTPGASTLIVTKDGQDLTFTYNTDPTIGYDPEDPEDPEVDQTNPGSGTVNMYTLFYDIVSLQISLAWFGISTQIVGTDLVFTNLTGDGITNVTETGTYLTVVVTESSLSAEALENKNPGFRYGNKSRVRMEIRYGKDISTFAASKVYVDYLRAPQYVRLTQEQLDEVLDTSQLLEFPDYVCQEITNELVKLLLENASDPRLQTHIPINQTIGNPQQQR